MTELSKLLQVSEAQKKAILESHGTSEQEFNENVNRLREWLEKCEHLPKEADDNKLKVILLNCKMSVEKAKQSLEGYYRVRTIHADFFDKMLPFTEHFEKARKMVKTAVMPKLTSDLCRITVFRLSDPEAICEDGLIYELILLMVAEIRMKKDYFLSNTIIVDYEEHRFKNIMKFTPTVNQTLADIMIALKLRIKDIHFVNMPPFIDHVMVLVKMVIPAKFVNKIHFHKNYESLYKVIPRELLPKNYGGTEPAIEELHEKWCHQLEENEAYFKKLLTAKSTKKSEMYEDQRDMFGLGSEGTFKKLALD